MLNILKYLLFCINLPRNLIKQEGASKEDIDHLSKYKFRRTGNEEKLSDDEQGAGGMMTECGTDSPIEHALSEEDAVPIFILSSFNRISCLNKEH